MTRSPICILLKIYLVIAAYGACAVKVVWLNNDDDAFSEIAGALLCLHMGLCVIAAFSAGLYLFNRAKIMSEAAIMGGLISALLTLPTPFLYFPLLELVLKVAPWAHSLTAVLASPVIWYPIGLILPGYITVRFVHRANLQYPA
jgi:hypothetical protein